VGSRSRLPFRCESTKTVVPVYWRLHWKAARRNVPVACRQQLELASTCVECLFPHGQRPAALVLRSLAQRTMARLVVGLCWGGVGAAENDNVSGRMNRLCFCWGFAARRHKSVRRDSRFGYVWFALDERWNASVRQSLPDCRCRRERCSVTVAVRGGRIARANTD
jgi:hypothetical protein